MDSATHERTIAITIAVITSMVYISLLFAEKKQRQMQLFSATTFVQGVIRFVIFVSAVIMGATTAVEVPEWFDWVESLVSASAPEGSVDTLFNSNLSYGFYVLVNLLQGFTSVIVAWGCMLDVRDQERRTIHNLLIGITRVPALVFFGCCMLLSGAIEQQRVFNMLNSTTFSYVYNEMLTEEEHVDYLVDQKNQNDNLKTLILILKAILVLGGVLFVIGGNFYEVFFPGTTVVLNTLEDEDRALEDGWFPPNRWYIDPETGALRTNDNEKYETVRWLDKDYIPKTKQDKKNAGKIVEKKKKDPNAPHRSKPIYRLLQYTSYIPMIFWSVIVSILATYDRSLDENVEKWNMINNEYYHQFLSISFIGAVLMLSIFNSCLNYRTQNVHSIVIAGAYVVFSWGVLRSYVLDTSTVFPGYVKMGIWNGILQVLLAIYPLLVFLCSHTPDVWLSRTADEVSDFTHWVAFHLHKLTDTPLERHPLRPLALMCGVAAVVLIMPVIFSPMYNLDIYPGSEQPHRST